jgi:hypothetical protein
MPPDVRPAVSEGLLPVHGSGVVAVLVPPLVLTPVSEPSVQLDHHAIAPVKAIPASPSAARVGERRLPDRLRQAVRPFHVPLVAKLQHRVVAAGRGSDEFVQVSPPAQLRPLAHGRAQPVLVGQVARERASHPAADVIEVRGRLRQVKHRLLDSGPRWITLRQHSLDRPRGPVNADSFSRNHAALARNCHVNHLGWLVGEFKKFRCCLMTEDCSRTS